MTKCDTMLNGSSRLVRLTPMVHAFIIQLLLFIIRCESSEIYTSSSYSSSSLSDGGNRITILEESSEGTGFKPKRQYTQIVETPRGTFVDTRPTGFVQVLSQRDNFTNGRRKNQRNRSTSQSAGRSINQKKYYLPYSTELMSDKYYRESNPYARDISKVLGIKQGHYTDLYQQIDTPNRQQQESPLKAVQETLTSIAQQLEQEISNPLLIGR